MDPQGFVALDAACEGLINEFIAAQTIAQQLGYKSIWGVGEEAGARFTSARELVQIFQQKGAGGPNNAYDTLTDYITAAQDIRALFKAICDEFTRTDAEFAAKMREIQA
ncbi:hypothetical protein D5S18_32925 [Nocardia panacis]|uniref:Uncharacterized protein n=2 Tax=Nocardia panacis TaxID=2340916 RepID=A0A3A4JIL6_9NOCA|nr:hypothetical protein D5S18_32925 [Nocardia panacis]